jgi:hypothetical protein
MLNTQQIDHLFGFCKKHYVQYYDVQVELVDHLANAVEEAMHRDESLSFEEALDKVYAGFGYAGFAHVVDAHIKSALKKNGDLRWKLFWSYFTWPKIGMMACLVLVLSAVLQFFPGVFWYVFTIVLIILMVHEWWLSRKIERFMKQNAKGLLITQAGTERPFLQIWLFGQFCNFLGKRITDPLWHTVFYELMSVFLVAILAALWAHRDQVYKLVDYAKRQYPTVYAPAG